MYGRVDRLPPTLPSHLLLLFFYPPSFLCSVSHSLVRPIADLTSLITGLSMCCRQSKPREVKRGSRHCGNGIVQSPRIFVMHTFWRLVLSFSSACYTQAQDLYYIASTFSASSYQTVSASLALQCLLDHIKMASLDQLSLITKWVSC